MQKNESDFWLGFSKKRKITQFIQLRSFGEIIVTSISSIHRLHHSVYSASIICGEKHHLHQQISQHNLSYY